MLQAVECKELESDKESGKMQSREWTGEQFRTRDVLIFIGAVQIAVRLIASFIGSKTTDPAVLVLDEKDNIVSRSCPGTFGGANEMAERIAEMAGALPVITTATDIRGKWAIDVICQKESSLYKKICRRQSKFRQRFWKERQSWPRLRAERFDRGYCAGRSEDRTGNL